MLRTAASIRSATDALLAVDAEIPAGTVDPAVCELANLVEVGAALLAAADAREESRGAHARTDFPGAHEAFRLRLVIGGPPAHG
ncbi:MAG TPA: hypothetical protein PKA24_08640 [Microthrixaceae bacterium]|nr:hypothetical protein [Microthrixaceae bacterium]